VNWRHSQQVRLLAILLFAICARAAVVEGVVLDEETGSPLARTLVTLVPLPGTKTPAAEADDTRVHTGARGSFIILNVRPGWYVIRATRRGYIPAESGQSKPGRPGHAFEVADDRAMGVVEIRMSHLAAITGTVLDENGIGIPNWSVHIYSARKPTRHAGQVETDDRGDYRIGELDPGTYFVRSGPGHLEDNASIIPIWSKSAVELKDAISVSLSAGQTQREVIIRPAKGRLFSLSGMLIPQVPNLATATLVTDTGRRDLASAGIPVSFSANNVSPGVVGLLVTGSDSLGRACGSYVEIVIDKDISGLQLSCNLLYSRGYSITGVIPPPSIFVRRVDLVGASESHVLKRDDPLVPGRWELSVARGNYYVESVRNFGSVSQSGSWYSFDVMPTAQLTIALSTRTSSISGVVSSKGTPVLGAPVFLVQSQTGETWTARSDPQGNYSIPNLGPGAYAILSSFDLGETDDISRLADQIVVTQGSVTTHPLELVLP
jgi:hypothetical protein